MRVRPYKLPEQAVVLVNYFTSKVELAKEHDDREEYLTVIEDVSATIKALKETLR